MKNVLYAFYDFSVAPATFDIATFMFIAEQVRRKKRLAHLHLVVVPGDEDGFLPNQFLIYRQLGAVDYQFDIMNWRLTNIIVPMGWLLPSCRKVTVCSSREEAQVLKNALAEEVFPAEYQVSDPKSCHETQDLICAVKNQNLFSSSVVPSMQALSFVDRWMDKVVKGRKLVTITLRECDYEAQRNSNVEEWLAFAAELDDNIYAPVFIRDMDKVFQATSDKFDGVEIFSEAVWNLELRAAIYHRSYLNMLLVNGPGGLCSYNRKSRFQIFYRERTCGAATYAYMASQGLSPGEQYKFFTPLQRFVWGNDDLSVIKQSFVWMSARIDKFMEADLLELLNITNEWLVEEKYSDAEWLASWAVARFPEATEPWILQAKVLRLAGETCAALEAVNRAAEIAETASGLDELQAIAKAMGREAEADTIAAYRQRTYS